MLEARTRREGGGVENSMDVEMIIVKLMGITGMIERWMYEDRRRSYFYAAYY